MQPTPATLHGAARGQQSDGARAPRRDGRDLRCPFLTPATAASLLSTCDPFLAAALPYYKHVLNHYLSRAYVACLGLTGTPATTQAVVSTTPVDPAPYLKTVTRRVPLLAMYPVNGRVSERTMHRSANACRYRLDYILRGDLNFEQHERVAPLLTAASSLLIVATDLGGLDHYQSGARILTDSGADKVSVVSWQIGMFRDEDLGGMFPRFRSRSMRNSTRATARTAGCRCGRTTSTRWSPVAKHPHLHLGHDRGADPMTSPSVTWAFAAVDDVNIQCPRALDAGVARVIGKRHDAESGAYVLAAPTTYTLSKREEAGLRAFFAKDAEARRTPPRRRGDRCGLRPQDPITRSTYRWLKPSRSPSPD